MIRSEELNKFKLYKKVWIYTGAPHNTFLLAKKDCLAILKQGGLLIRNDFDFDIKEETSFWYIIKDSFSGMTELSSKVRNQVRRAQNIFDIIRIDKEKLLQEGFEVHLSAMMNYKVKSKPISKEIFINRITNCGIDYQFWGCLKKDTGELIAFAINHIFEGQCNYETFKAKPEYLRTCYPFYGLLYEMNRYYLEDLKLNYVCDGARSITEHSNIQPFLEEKFNFRKAYCKILITYKWWLKPLINILYPFRKYLKISSMKAILKQEEMARNILNK
jgi:hypothetical protein